MADKKISELDQTLILSDQADFPISQDNGGEPTTFRAKLTQIATKIAEAITFSNLKTGNKQLVSAVNQTISNLADDFNTTAGSTYAKDDCVLYNGVLYQCINNSGTTSGTFIAADWTEIKAVDVGSGGGGGGGAGGHTIVDDSGTSLTQRTNLQFKGAYSEDNSTDDTTEIDVVREMTKAEFDELTEAEKTGLINITDITGGNDDRFQPVIYSEDEREIGVWTDGKPLYQKTLKAENVTIPVSSGYLIDISALNVDCIVEMPSGYIKFSTDMRSVPFGILGNYGMAVDANPTTVTITRKGTDISVTVVEVTIRYTKSTDQAGSGQWTPQGVPAHHYSTDEQVVGTWIDGSTLYEKTYHNSSITIASNTELTIDDFSNKFPISCCGVMHNSTDDRTYYPNYSYAGAEQANIYYKKDGNGNLVLRSESDSWGSTWEVFTTVRYTKSST